MPVATLDLPTLAVYAREVARAFGLARPILEPRDERQRKALLRDLSAALHGVRPIAAAKSIGEVLANLTASGQERAVRRQLAELDDLVASATFARTKRAERGRVFALLLLVFDLVHVTGVRAEDEPEATLRLVRRARRGRAR